MKLIIILKLPSKIVKRMSIQRKKYHPSGISHLPAHITLVPPFVLKGRLDALYKDLRYNVQRAGPFTLKLHGMGNFARHVFFKPNCPPELRKIHKQLKKLIGSTYRQRRPSDYWRFVHYTPHMTIAKVPRNRVAIYKEKLKRYAPKNLRCAVDGIEIWQEVLWIRKKTLLFNKK